MPTNEKIKVLRHKLRLAKQCKINKEKELRSVRTSLSSMNEELAGLMDGIEFSQQQLDPTYCGELQLSEQLLELVSSTNSIFDTPRKIVLKNKLRKEQKEQIVKAQHVLTIVEMYNTCEKTKNEVQQKLVEEYKKGFLELFEKGRISVEKANKEQRRQEEALQEIKKEKKLQIMKQNEEQMIEILSVEAECDHLEQECAVLKKRNKAIMLQLRRKLMETEETRKALLQIEPETK